MGVARLLAKGWVVFCLFAGAHALNFALGRGAPPWDAFASIIVCVLLFGAFGLLFIAGFGASTGSPPSLRRLKPRLPGFNELVFLAFVTLSLLNQIFLAPQTLGHSWAQAVELTLSFAVPGQAALVAVLRHCSLDGGRDFAGAFAWLLAIVYVASSLSRVRLTAGLLRLDQALRPSAFGPTALAAIYGFAAIVAFQLLYVGSLYSWLECGMFDDVSGAVLIGLGPLLLAYLIVAALATLRASGPER